FLIESLVQQSEQAGIDRGHPPSKLPQCRVSQIKLFFAPSRLCVKPVFFSAFKGAVVNHQRGHYTSPMRTLALLALCCCLLPAQSTVTIAGTGAAGFSGDGGPATQAQVNNPYGLVVGPDGALYFCEIGNHRVRRLDLKTKTISTAAGSGQKGYSGDGGPALQASLNEPYEVVFDTAGNMYFAEMQNHVVRRVDAKTRIITTVAGTGSPGFGGDGGPAAQAQLRQPHSIAFDPQGRLMICDIGNLRIRRVNLQTGTIET